MAGDTILETFVTRYLFEGDFGEISRIERRVNSLSQTFDRLGRAAQVAGVFLTGVGALALRSFAQVETEQAKMKGLVGVAEDQLRAYRDGYSRLVDETGQSVHDLAKGMYFIESAGFSGAQGLGILEVSAKASTAGLGEMRVIANLVTDVLGAYGSENISAAEATDQLTAAVREGKLEPSNLATSFAKVLPLANKLEIEFSEVAGAMAAMSRQGFNAEMGSTALRGIFSKLIKPTQQGEKELEKYGLTMQEVTKAAGEQGLLYALQKIVTAVGKNEKAFGKIFEDIEGLNGIFALTNQTFADNVRITNEVANSAGALDNAFRPAFETLGMQAQLTKNNFIDAMTQIGEIMAPVALTALEFANSVLDSFQELDGGSKKLVAQVLSIGPALLGLAAVLRVVSVALKVLVPFIGGASAALKILIPFMGRASSAFHVLKVAAIALFAVMRAHPILAIVSAVALLITQWDTLQTAIRDGAVKIRQWFEDMLPDWVKRFFVKVETQDDVKAPPITNPRNRLQQAPSEPFPERIGAGPPVANPRMRDRQPVPDQRQDSPTPEEVGVGPSVANPRMRDRQPVPDQRQDSPTPEEVGWFKRLILSAQEHQDAPSRENPRMRQPEKISLNTPVVEVEAPVLDIPIEPPMIPTQPPHAPGPLTPPPPLETSKSITNSVDVGRINVTVPGGDSQEISQNVGRVLRDQIQTVVEDQDTFEA